MRIAQISDMHLSRSHGYFYHNWEVVLEAVNRTPPDLVVLTGDISFNGADSPADLEFAAEQISRITAPTAVIPGNHDVGDHPHSKKLDQPVTETRYRRWLDVFGSDRFSLDGDGLRIIGFATALLGSGLDRELDQWEWLSEQIETATSGDTPILLFMHKPLFTREPHEPAFNKSAVAPESRRHLWTLLGQSTAHTVASAHVHVYKQMYAQGIDFVWCPATSFVVTWEGKDVYDGVRRTGYLEWEWSTSDGPDRFTLTHRWQEPARLVNYDLRNWFRDYGSSVHLPPSPLR